MTDLARCPNVLPRELISLVETFGRTWAASPLRPHPAQHVIKHWSNLLAEWVADGELPLFVRKQANIRGSVVQHESGRALIYCDNSPAHWAYVMASRGECPTVAEIRSLLVADSIPVVMIQKTAEKPKARYHCNLPKNFNVNMLGWKLAHIKGVGLKSRTPVSTLPLERLIQHFSLLMAPANMFLVPLEWAGIAEIDAVISAVANVQLDL